MRPQNQADHKVIAERLYSLAAEIAIGAVRVTWFSEGLAEKPGTGETYDGLTMSWERA